MVTVRTVIARLRGSVRTGATSVLWGGFPSNGWTEPDPVVETGVASGTG